MASTTTSKFTRRCLFLCLFAGVVVTLLGVRLVQLQLLPDRQFQPGSNGIRIVEEIIPARRGLIMDSQNPSRHLTSNTLSGELVADVDHLYDPKLIAYTLAFARAYHTDEWAYLDDRGCRRLIEKERAKLLTRATIKKDESEKLQLSKILSEDTTSPDKVVIKPVPLDEKSPRDFLAKVRKEGKLDIDICQEYIDKNMEYVAQVLAPFLPDMTPEQLLSKLRQDGVEKKKRRLVLAQNLTGDQVNAINDAILMAHIQGISCASSWKRSYLSPTMLTHVLGYVGQNIPGSHLLTGSCGVEQKLDGYLLGQDGVRETRRNQKGLLIASKDDRFKPAIDGRNIKLTINMTIQQIIEEELDRGLAYYRAPRGTIIVVEPKTGNILAMASRPHFNLNTKENMQEGAFNFAVQGLYEPGSTFKVVSVTSAVDSGKASFSTPIDCTTAPVPGANPVTDKPRSYGTLTVAEVLKKSSNPGAFRIGVRAGGWNVYKKYLKAYGFLDPTGIELPSEARSQCQDGSNFVNFSRMTYGYSVMVSPLQVAMAYAAIANDGVRMRPRLVEGIYDRDGRLVEKREPQEVCRVMKESTAKAMKVALAGVAGEGGTARRGNVPGYQIGGKTGTAHKVREKGGGYYPDRYTVSFVGMLPIEDPAFVCLVVVDDPHPTDCHPGGGTVCAPIFKEAATRIAAALNIPKKSEPDPKEAPKEKPKKS